MRTCPVVDRDCGQLAFSGDQVAEGAHGGGGEVTADHDRRPLVGGPSGVAQGFGFPGGGPHNIRPYGGQRLIHCLAVAVEIVDARQREHPDSLQRQGVWRVLGDQGDLVADSVQPGASDR
jgi:hypothetical protein